MILQARLGSTRLPGKTMMPLAGRPLIWRIIERVQRCEALDQIVVATTSKPEDDVIEDVVTRAGVSVFRGSENDLVDRYYQAASAHDAETVVRLPADNPVPEPNEIDRIVRHHRTGAGDFCSNLAEIDGSGYPDGIGAEVFSFASLEAIWRQQGTPERREHVHLNFFDYAKQVPTEPDLFTVSTLPCPDEFRRPDLVLDVNTATEYLFMRDLYEALYPKDAAFTIVDVIAWIEAEKRGESR